MHTPNIFFFFFSTMHLVAGTKKKEWCCLHLLNCSLHILIHSHTHPHIQATQSLETVEKSPEAESGGPKQEIETDMGAIHQSSSRGFIVNKPDPSILSTGQHIRHNYRGGLREYQRQPTLPSLPEVEGSTEEGVASEDGVAMEDGKENSNWQQKQQLTTL